MKDSLKDFIDENRPAFDNQDPSEKNWSRIESSLPGMKTRSLWNQTHLWRAAAFIFLGLSVYLLVSRPLVKPPRNEPSGTQHEFTDLETFYSNQIEEKLALISNLETTGQEDQFTQDFQKLEAMVHVLKEELKNHPGEKVRDALVLNFLVQIDLLNQQIKRLEERKKPQAKSGATIA